MESQVDLSSERWLLLGASRGLGREFALKIKSLEMPPSLALSSRKLNALQDLKSELVKERPHWNISFVAHDLSTPPDMEKMQLWLNETGASRIFYFAGGGPYGLFHEKDWTDHLWAWHTSFMSAAALLHTSLRLKTPPRQFTFIGSAIAEAQADPRASSYAAAKHALRGLIDSLVSEGCPIDLRLMSPGYMATDMIPPKVRSELERQHRVWDPKEVAAHLLTWCLSPTSTHHCEMK